MGSKSFAIVLLILIFSLFSCSDTAPEIMSLYPQVVYDVEEEELYLSTYASFISDPMRIDSMEISHVESHLLWYCDSLERILSTDKKSKYVGYSAFVPAENGFPAGKYEVTFYDGVKRTTKSTFTLKKITIKKDYEQISRKKEYIAIFDENNSILSVEKDENKITEDKIASTFQDAIYYRKIIQSVDDNVLYLSKKQNVSRNKD